MRKGSEMSPEEQYGFRKGRSCTDIMLILKQYR